MIIISVKELRQCISIISNDLKALKAHILFFSEANLSSDITFYFDNIYKDDIINK